MTPHPHLPRRTALGRIAVLLGACPALLPALGAAQSAERFPASPVNIVVPFPPGGTNDVVARSLAQALSEAWKLPVVVENKAGAAGNLGADAVARSPATGHTLLLGAVSMLTNPSLYKIPPYVPRALVSVGVGVNTQLVTVVRSELKVKDMPDLIALSISRNGLNAASAGAGTLSHLGLELLKQHHRARLNHVPYRGSAPALTDLMAGQVDLMIDSLTSAAGAIATGKVRAIAVHTPQRIAQLPAVPTYEEQGIKGMTFGAWNMFMVPSGTPTDRIASLNFALAKAIREPALTKSLADRGLEVIVQSPRESLEFMQEETSRWDKLIKDGQVSL